METFTIAMTISRKKMAATASPATMPRVTLSDMEVSKEGACLRRGVLAHGCHGRRKAEAWKKLPGLEHDERTWTGAKGARGGTGVPQRRWVSSHLAGGGGWESARDSDCGVSQGTERGIDEAAKCGKSGTLGSETGAQGVAGRGA